MIVIESLTQGMRHAAAGRAGCVDGISRAGCPYLARQRGRLEALGGGSHLPVGTGWRFGGLLTQGYVGGLTATTLLLSSRKARQGAFAPEERKRVGAPLLYRRKEGGCCCFCL